VAAASGAEVLPPVEAVPDAAAAPQQGAEAERALAEGVRLPVAAPRDAVAEVRRQAARDAPRVLLLAVAWAAVLSTQLQEDRLAPSLPAQSAHARARLRIAQP
jgi:hypothetical protein